MIPIELRMLPRLRGSLALVKWIVIPGAALSWYLPKM
jgi:hypothetical protein